VPKSLKTTITSVNANRPLRPIDSLDHASRLPNYGSKMGVDATRKRKAEGFDRHWPAMIEIDRATKTKIDAMWAKLGL
jgi:4-hydroxy-3-polyprenylbenzoate decarboxylase